MRAGGKLDGENEDEARAAVGVRKAQLAALARPPERGSTVGFGKRIGDGTTEAVSRLTDVGVGGSLELSEARVARALAKLAEGSYGVCDGCLLHFVVLFDDAERASRDAAGWHVCLDRLEEHLGGAAAQAPSSEPTPDWRAHYEEYQRRGLPAGAPLPGA